MANLEAEPWNSELERQVRDALRAIRFGTVTLVIQDIRASLFRSWRFAD